MAQWSRFLIVVSNDSYERGFDFGHATRGIGIVSHKLIGAMFYFACFKQNSCSGLAYEA